MSPTERSNHKGSRHACLLSKLRFVRMGPHIVLQNYGCADFVHQLLVLPCLPPQASVNHSLVGQYRSEAFVIIVDWHLRNLFPQPGHKLSHAIQIFARTSVGLTRLTNNYAFHTFTGNIFLEKSHQTGCRDSRQPSCYNLKRVGDCQSCTLLAVVYRKYSSHVPINISSLSTTAKEQPCVGIFRAEFIAACSGISLTVECCCNNTVHITVLVLHNLSVVSPLRKVC